MQSSGHARVELAAHDVGTGAYTIMGQTAAQRLGLLVGAVKLSMGNSNLPIAPLAGGSVISASAGSTVHLARINSAAEVARTLVELDGYPFL